MEEIPFALDADAMSALMMNDDDEHNQAITIISFSRDWEGSGMDSLLVLAHAGNGNINSRQFYLSHIFLFLTSQLMRSC